MEPLTTSLIDLGFTIKLFDDVIYGESEERDVELFVFPFGCVTIWLNIPTIANDSKDILHKILQHLSAFEVDKADEVISDFINFAYNPEMESHNNAATFIDEEHNKIILGDKSEYVKLSISHALAQSIKLSILEKSVSSLLATTAPIQQELARTGTISLSKKDLSKKIGTLFSERYLINLHSDILDTPEFFWKRPSYEPIYLMTAQFQDISVRQSILNHRLDVIQELYNILSNELNYKHSARLEITIVVLITIEVILALLHNETIINFFGL
jgi:uncharacterized Rmd1/YagE family protein